jgi:putative ABC transport system permease protein
MLPDWSGIIRRRLKRLRVSPAREREIVDELSQHLQDRYDELRAGSASDQSARLAAIAELDAGDLVAEIAGVERPAGEPVPLGGGTDGMVAGLFQDIQFGARLLAKDWSASLVIVVTLGLAIAANAIVFGFTDLLLLRPLPLGNAKRLVAMYSGDRRESQNRQRLSMPEVLDVKAQNRSFEDIGAMTYREMSLAGAGEPLAVLAAAATPNLHRVMDIPAFAGRTLAPEDTGAERGRVAVLSHRFWGGHFAATGSSAIDKMITLNGLSYTIVGILTPDIEVGNLTDIDIWIPLELNAAAPREDRSLTAFGLLEPGVTVAAATADLTAIGERIEREHQVTNSGRRLYALSLRDATVGSSAWIILTLLGLVVGLVLIAACANVATVMLARASTRRREIAVRVALGATRARLVRQLVSEGLLIGFASGAVGVLLAYAGLIAFRASNPETFFQRLAVNGNVIAFAAALSIVAPVLFGIVPALQSSRPNLNEDLKDGGREGGSSARGNRSRSALVVAQVALAFVILIVAGLDVRTVKAVEHLPLGFDPAGVFTTRVRFDPPRYLDDAGRFRMVESMLDRLRAIPGVTAAAATSSLPGVEGGPIARFVIAGRPAPAANEIPWAIETAVEGNYSRTFGVRVFEGRMWTPDDRASHWGVAVVNREAVRRYWLDRSPVGDQFVPVDASGHPAGEPVQIVGVVDNTLGSAFNEPPPPRLYRPLATRSLTSVAFAVRGAGDGAQLAASVRGTLGSADRDLAIAQVRQFSDVVDDALREFYLILALFIGFASIGLVVAVAGVYGVTAFSVGQRRHEIGIRLALGATTHDVLNLIVARTFRLIGLGMALGAVAAWMIGLGMRSVLVGVGAGDPLTYAAVFVVLAFGGVLATYAPAFRALAIEPYAVLRRE